MSQVPARVLLVEGDDDLRVIPWLVESSGIPWGRAAAPLVKIVSCGGVDELLRPGEIETQLKASGISALGVIVDADESVDERWSRIRSRISRLYPTAPQSMPPQGVVLRAEAAPTFGAWIMPDNVNSGMLETFLLFLRPQDNQRLLQLADTTIVQARDCGAPFLDSHADKARIYSWGGDRQRSRSTTGSASRSGDWYELKEGLLASKGC